MTNRTIKFRAWDEGWKEMIHPYVIQCDINSGITVQKGLKSSTNELYYPLEENLTFMQFSELYDCEGKEIYEGDIIEYDDYDFYNNKMDKKVAEVIVENGMFVVSDKENLPVLYALEGICVIGNIFEHPNLLKDES